MILNGKNKKKLYRPNVAAIVVSSRYPDICEVLIAKRVSAKTKTKKAWQFPQGGIEQNETVDKALYRELDEEIGTSDITILSKYPKKLRYDFPLKIQGKMGPYTGQEQQYYLVKLNNGAKIDINTPIPEFRAYKFVQYDKIFDYVATFKRTNYKQVLNYFRNEGYLS
ncbi:MAG: RNA pyrophosphohydrolase [Epsilonproteobacteria bacterium]|nr:MAG: RNA pyrophosphohydrolase [Campylobacterota bacterium]